MDGSKRILQTLTACCLESEQAITWLVVSTRSEEIHNWRNSVWIACEDTVQGTN